MPQKITVPLLLKSESKLKQVSLTSCERLLGVYLALLPPNRCDPYQSDNRETNDLETLVVYIHVFPVNYIITIAISILSVVVINLVVMLKSFNFFSFLIIDFPYSLLHLSEGVILKLQERFSWDRDALKRVLESFGIDLTPENERAASDIFRSFPDTPVKMLKDVFEALQLYDLLELLEIKPMKPYRSLQLEYTLDEIKRLNPITYHSCGAVLIITNDENASNASEIKNFFTDLDNKSDVTEVIQDIKPLKHLEAEIDAMKDEILAFANLLEGETQRQTRMTQILFSLRLLINALGKLKLKIQQEGSQDQPVIIRLWQLKHDIDIMRLDLKKRFPNPSKGQTWLRQTDEFKSFLQSMMVTVERIQENLTQLIQRSHEWFVKEKEKEEQNFRENVSAVVNRWIHRQGKYE